MPPIKIGQTDGGEDVFADEAMVQRFQGQGGGGLSLNLQTAVGAFQVITGLIDQDTLANLQQDLRDQRDDVDERRADMQAFVDLNFPVGNAIGDAFRKQLGIERTEADAISTDIELARMQRSAAMYRAVGGAGQVAAGYQGAVQAVQMPGGGWGIPGPGGVLVPLLLGGVIGHQLGQNSGEDRDRRGRRGRST
jgi:hypothetical protein